MKELTIKDLDTVATNAARDGLRDLAGSHLWAAKIACEDARKDNFKKWAEQIDTARKSLDRAEAALIRAALVKATA